MVEDYPERLRDFTQEVPPAEAYGITLRRLRAQDLELVRQHRNSPEIQATMVYREHITEEMQRAWFARVNNRENFYSVIYFEGEAVGMSHVKNVDWSTMVGEGGMMIWDKRHQNSSVPFLAALLGNDWMFKLLGMNEIFVRVLKTNKRAIRYNRALGYAFEPPAPDSDVVIGRLNVQAFDRATQAIRFTLTGLRET